MGDVGGHLGICRLDSDLQLFDQFLVSRATGTQWKNNECIWRI